MIDHNQQSALQKLAFLEGSWVNIGNVAAGSFGPGGAISGCSVYSWNINNTWLMYKSELNLPGFGAYEVTGGVSFNSQRSCYIAFAANSMGHLLFYEGNWEENSSLVLMQVFPLPGGLARIRYQKSDENTIWMFSDRRPKSGNFETYFETILKPNASLH